MNKKKMNREFQNSFEFSEFKTWSFKYYGIFFLCFFVIINEILSFKWRNGNGNERTGMIFNYNTVFG
jgi:hypothetical protein